MLLTRFRYKTFVNCNLLRLGFFYWLGRFILIPRNTFSTPPDKIFGNKTHNINLHSTLNDDRGCGGRI